MKTSSTGKPLVSILTASKNAAATLGACLASVQAQTYPHIEHIVVDGASTDGTQAMLRESPGIVWASEPDDGVYDAWNKGLERAQGEWIAFLGADEAYLPDAVEAYMALAAKQPKAEYLSSQARRIAANGRGSRFGGPWGWPRFQRYMCVAHAGSMYHRRLFQSYGRFDTTYRAAAEYEFLLRGLGFLQTAYLPQVTVETRAAGGSARALVEAQRAKRETGGRAEALVAAELLRAKTFFFVRRLLTRHA
ncbi:glycosyltransferase family 2 protein [Granulicella rosea]|uniref:glycosyltransferase family 2 protein n=1 Tax=Granulicella rosea TaxID=474952 RepID=UPI001595006F|nr:glycosyltransferase family 2 protein [Granulicella rosea]